MRPSVTRKQDTMKSRNSVASAAPRSLPKNAFAKRSSVERGQYMTLANTCAKSQSVSSSACRCGPMCEYSGRIGDAGGGGSSLGTRGLLSDSFSAFFSALNFSRLARSRSSRDAFVAEPSWCFSVVHVCKAVKNCGAGTSASSLAVGGRSALHLTKVSI